MNLYHVIEVVKRFFQPFWSWLSDVFNSISWLAWVCLLLGILLMIGTYYLVRYFIRKDPPPEKPKEEDGIPDVYKMPPVGGWLSRALSRKGFFKIGRLSVDFLNSLSFLEETLKTSQYKYKNPWLAVVGGEGSGKTTLVKTLQSIKASWQAERQDESDTECNWFFLRSGVVLDIKGKLFLEKGGIRSDEVGWNALKSLLVRYRSAKPLDSILLTLSMEDLYGRDRLSSLQCLERAKFMAQKLSTFQDQLGLKIPIYVVITKTDLVPGFREFCQKLPLSTKQQMLGWSSPYTPETAYSPRWVPEMIKSVTEQIQHVSMDLFCEHQADQTQDSLYVFPFELRKIEDNLTIYLNQIFQTSQYKTPLLLRGVYFCGDSDRQPVEASQTEFIDERLLSSSMRLEANENGEESASENKDGDNDSEEVEKEAPRSTGDRSSKVFFFGDLVYNKILMEYTLCVPQKGKYFAGNKSVKILKISSASLLAVGGTGLYFAYQSFQNSKSLVEPALNSMYRFLVQAQQIPLLELSKKNSDLEASVRKLSGVMKNLMKADFFSFFVPASWFSPLRSRLNDALNLAYQNVLMRALYVNLLLKARELLHTSVEDIPVTTSLAQLAIPTKSYEFEAMNRYVTDLTKLSEYVDKFNDLRLVASPRVLSELVDYAFKMTLPASFLQDYGKIRTKLSTSAFPAIDLTVYKNLAIQTFSKIFQHFFNVIFIHSYAKSFPGQLEQMIQTLRHTEGKLNIDLDKLRTLSKDFETVMQFFEGDPSSEKAGEKKEKPVNWMDKEVFEPGEEFENFLCEIDRSPFFGPEISQAVVNNCAIGMYHLRRSLKDLTKLLTTDFRFETDPADAKDEHPCSEGFLILGRSIRALFAEPYMRRASGHQFVETVPEGQMLYWDDKLLKAACDLCTQYESFATKKVGEFPVLIQESFRLMAREGLQRHVMSLIARSQNFLSEPVKAGQVISEESVRSQTANTRLVAPLLLKLIELLNHESVGFFYVNLRDLLLTSQYKVLDQINALMQQVGPYHVWDPTFSWWDGQSNPAFAAYGVKDTQDLNISLDIQGQHVINLAINLAKPVVDFLMSETMLTVNPLNRHLLTKWKRIVAQAELYQNKQPGSSMAQLEQFITTTLKGYRLDNVFEEIKIADLRQDPGDHFLETKQTIQKGVFGRAEILIRQRNLKNYQDLAKFFNERLRGKFPFTPPSTDVSQSIEADPEDLRLFLEKFKQYGGSAEKILDQIYQLGTVAAPAVVFLQRVQQIADLFGDYLNNHGQGIPFLVVDSAFNTNKERTVGANYVAEWSLKINDDEVVNQSSKNKKTQWVYGCPTEVSFRWPQVKGLPDQPFSDPRQFSLTVQDSIATFTFYGKWSLLRLIRQQRAPRSDYTPMLNPNAIVLKFTIPVSERRNAVLYNSISILGASENPNIPGKALPFPEFPSLAPDLSLSLNEVLNEPVLAAGLVAPASVPPLK